MAFGKYSVGEMVEIVDSETTRDIYNEYFGDLKNYERWVNCEYHIIGAYSLRTLLKQTVYGGVFTKSAKPNSIAYVLEDRGGYHISVPKYLLRFLY